MLGMLAAAAAAEGTARGGELEIGLGENRLDLRVESGAQIIYTSARQLYRTLEILRLLIISIE